MKRLSILFALLLAATVGYAQSGAEVLSTLSRKIDAMGSYRIDFVLEMDSATQSAKGFCEVDNPLYKIGVEVLDDYVMQGYDGEKLWSVDHNTMEATYDDYNPQSHSLFENPTKAFDFSRELFSVEGFGEANAGEWVIELKPQAGVLTGIDVVNLTVDKNSGLPTRLSYNMAGAEISIKITSIKPKTFWEEHFVADIPDYYELIDFR